LGNVYFFDFTVLVLKENANMPINSSAGIIPETVFLNDLIPSPII